MSGGLNHACSPAFYGVTPERLPGLSITSRYPTLFLQPFLPHIPSTHTSSPGVVPPAVRETLHPRSRLTRSSPRHLSQTTSANQHAPLFRLVHALPRHNSKITSLLAMLRCWIASPHDSQCRWDRCVSVFVQRGRLLRVDGGVERGTSLERYFVHCPSLRLVVSSRPVGCVMVFAEWCWKQLF